MQFDALLQQMYRRLREYQHSRQMQLVLDPSVLAEADALWEAAQPNDRDHPDPDTDRRLAAACYALGWLRFFRSTARTTDLNSRPF